MFYRWIPLKENLVWSTLIGSYKQSYDSIITLEVFTMFSNYMVRNRTGSLTYMSD